LRAHLQQQFDDVNMPLGARPVQRRAVANAVVFQVRIGTVLRRVYLIANSVIKLGGRG
jgi:hypothetical protein